jgi:hypothetical protein
MAVRPAAGIGGKGLSTERTGPASRFAAKLGDLVPADAAREGRLLARHDRAQPDRLQLAQPRQSAGYEKVTSWPKIGEMTVKADGAGPCAAADEASNVPRAAIVAPVIARLPPRRASTIGL